MLSRRVRLRRGVCLSLFSRPRKRGTDLRFRFFYRDFPFFLFQSSVSSVECGCFASLHEERWERSRRRERRRRRDQQADVRRVIISTLLICARRTPPPPPPAPIMQISSFPIYDDETNVVGLFVSLLLLASTPTKTTWKKTTYSRVDGMGSGSTDRRLLLRLYHLAGAALLFWQWERRSKSRRRPPAGAMQRTNNNKNQRRQQNQRLGVQ